MHYTASLHVGRLHIIHNRFFLGGIFKNDFPEPLIVQEVCGGSEELCGLLSEEKKEV